METPTEKEAREHVLELSRAYIVSRALHVAAELGVADHVGDTPVHVSRLAAATSCRPELLERIMRLLASHRVFSETSPGEFVATPFSNALRSDAPSSLRPGLMMVNAAWWAAVGDVGHSVRTGETAFTFRQSEPFFAYLKDHPADQATFDAGMAANSRASDQAIAAAYDFSGAKSFVDVGGGRGGLVRAILERWPNVRGVLFDQPQVVAQSVIPSEGPIAVRCDVRGGDFFGEIPSGADVYVIKGVLHDFDDARCAAILASCRRAMTPQSKLLVVERTVLPDNRPHQAKTIDVLMMALLGGKERHVGEWKTLLEKTGLALARELSTESEFTIFECRA